MCKAPVTLLFLPLSLSFLLTAKNFFRVSFRSGGQLQTHCFQASDAFNKQQWINCIRQAKEAATLSGGTPAQTGRCEETALGGQIGPLAETELRLCGDSELEDEKGSWGEIEPGLGLEGEEGVNGEKDLTSGEGEEPETAGEMEAVLAVDGDLELDNETRLGGSETDAGVEMEIVQGVGDEDNLKADEGSGGGDEGEEEEVDDLSSGDNDISSSISADQEEREVMEEEQNSAEGEEEVGMETSDMDSLQGEEVSFRC